MRLARLLFSPRADGPGWLWPRWLFLRALGLIFLSAFYSLAFQIHGLIGERGILPARDYLAEVAALGAAAPGPRLWLAPTLLWLGAGDRALIAVVAAGVVCSLLLVLNVWPRLSVALCTLLFLSCVAALQDFSSYQSDGMLLEAGFLSIFFAPRGVRPRLGAHDPPSRASLFLLQWEWFRIYFESGVVKLASGDPHWRDFTAMDNYYENGPLPAWPGWYVQHFPHWYHAGTVALTLVVELVIVWALFLPRRFRLGCFVVVTALQVGIIATANYAFLNYLVLVLGVLLLDDRALARVGLRTPPPPAEEVRLSPWRTWTAAVALTWVFYATVAEVLFRGDPVLAAPARALAPFRIANEYGLFAVMTEARYEIEFQGSRDGGRTWIAYPFRYKPQDPRARPGIYAPYQPRFEWNLWFASLAPWQQSPWVVSAQARLLDGSPSVLALFARNPFPGAPPTQVRTVLWRYWFTDAATKRATGAWWRRALVGPFTGVLGRGADGRVVLTGWPQ
ncbi:MAG TPA: lipase maturation factor family protein [Gemmatimonadaceae bacterium]|nr:lipase maturation factor family protein [Gemmatimonadaceae bacterium]